MQTNKKQNEMTVFPARVPETDLRKPIQGYSLPVRLTLMGRGEIVARFTVHLRCRVSPRSGHSVELMGLLRCDYFGDELVDCMLVQQKRDWRKQFILISNSVLSRIRQSEATERWKYESTMHSLHAEFVMIPISGKKRKVTALKAPARLNRGDRLSFRSSCGQIPLTVYQDPSGNWAPDNVGEDRPYSPESRERVLIENYLGHLKIEGILFYNAARNTFYVGVSLQALHQREQASRQRFEQFFARIQAEYGVSVNIMWLLEHPEEYQQFLQAASE